MYFIPKASLLTILSICLYASVTAQTRKYQIAQGLFAQITHAQGSPVVEVAMPGVELITLDLTQPATNTFQIKTSDYNFDGYKDFALMSVNQASGMQIYDIFLYHPSDKSFEGLEVPGGVCELLANVRTSVAEKTLRSSCRNGTKSSLDIYKWAGPFELELVKSVDNSAETQAEKAEEKADQKAEKAEKRKEVREQRKEAREEDDDE